MLDEGRLRNALAGASADAGLDPSSLVVYLVDAVRPSGTTPLAYLHPEGVVTPGTVAVFRAVAERAAEDRLTAHRLALWGELPGIPEAALAPMLRHELEHACRWERSGPRFFEADELLRAAVRADGGRGYGSLPSELEANAASSRYAERTLSTAERDQLVGSPVCVALVADAQAPGDVVAATLAELGRRADWSPRLDAAAPPRLPCCRSGGMPGLEPLARRARGRPDGRGDRGHGRLNVGPEQVGSGDRGLVAEG